MSCRVVYNECQTVALPEGESVERYLSISTEKLAKITQGHFAHVGIGKKLYVLNKLPCWLKIHSIMPSAGIYESIMQCYAMVSEVSLYSSFPECAIAWHMDLMLALSQIRSSVGQAMLV